MSGMNKVDIFFRCMPAVFASFVLTGCAGGMDDLEQYIAQVKDRPSSRIEPLPQIKPYETFDYSVQDRRSPFVRNRPTDDNVGPSGPAPIKNRNKEYLEQFPLDTLSMVGTLQRDGELYGLIQTNDGLLHRVLPGNYIGQNDGRIVSVTEGSIEVEELVSNGIGSFFKRTAEIGID